ncbi:MAG: efflux transporter periplasmic adaptor subunit [Deltaproteobacteria bacterium RIFOXYA2_FULL_55_11]|nr:MAG: efflux transporter periplasmic adaptor subunit [Deltaproteobacteria bacterium RIFOXYA2_FULL_55_11]
MKLSMGQIKTAMKRHPWIAIGLVLAGVVVGYNQISSGTGKKLDKRSGARQAIPVSVAHVIQKTLPVQLRAVGIVEAYSTVSVRSQITGTLTNVHFKEGQDVKKGELLFTIDPRPFEAALKQVEANLARDLAQFENAVQQARRYGELVKKQYVSQEQYDQIRTNAGALEAVVQADKAAVENAKVQLGYCYIYSSVTGRTGSLLVNEGNLVRVNDATPLLVINQVSPIYVNFTLPEQNLQEIKKRMAGGKLGVQAIIPRNEALDEQGALGFVDNAVDRTTGTIRLKATFANDARRLWPGAFVNVLVTLAMQPDAVVVPSQAVQTGQEGQHVFVVKSDQTVELRKVIVNRTVNSEAVIDEGLKPGETVVTDGQFQLAPGVKVEARKEIAS